MNNIKYVEERSLDELVRDICRVRIVPLNKSLVKMRIQKIIDSEKINTKKVNRIELIDWTSKGKGRDYVKWVKKPFEVKMELQDQKNTLKIFLKDK